jgi:hypothetical protein
MKKFILIGVVAVVLSLSVWAYFWVEDWEKNKFSAAHPAALTALESDSKVRVDIDDWIVFSPATGKPEKAFIFYPGGDCDERGYAEPLRQIAEAGYLVVLVPMPFYLAVLAPNKAEKVLATFPDIEKWAIGGHSLGGAMAARYVYTHPGEIDGLLLWDAYPPETDDISSRDLAVRLVHRADASGVPPDYYNKFLPNLPSDLELAPVVGASHINFGHFRPATRFRDAPSATIPITEQHEQIAVASVNFLRKL